MNDTERESLAYFVVSVGNAFRLINKAGDSLVDVLGKPVLADSSAKPSVQVFNSLNWISKEGLKGSYEQAENDNSEDFEAISRYVVDHKGFCILHGFKVWLHNNDPSLIDRKR